MSTERKNGKRKSADDSTSGAAKKGHWALGLQQAAADPSLSQYRDDQVVIIKDRYPKARHHYLVLPHLSLASLKNLSSEHVGLMQHMHKEASKFMETKHPGITFKMGYHAIPSMAQVHMHVVSDDFDSPCLKTKKHWNSFNTEYFIPSEQVISDLQSDGRVRHCAASEGKKLLETPLRCHKCSFQPANLPKLKQHLLTHLPPK